jgi:transcriptional regulator with XRE-family HTH domain
VEIRECSEQFAKTLIGLMAAERVSRKLSHEDLAKAAGIHRTTVSRIESGQMRPTLEVVCCLAKALGMDFAELVKKTSMALPNQNLGQRQ